MLDDRLLTVLFILLVWH